MKKVLFLDIETSSVLSETWGMYQQNVLRIVRDWQLMAVSYKWKGAKKVECIHLSRKMDEKQLVKSAWKLIDEADIMVAHNGDKFDLRKLYAKFVEHGLKPPRPVETVDTKKVAKRYFMFTSNKLDHMGQLLGLGRKVQTGGYNLWVQCYNGDAAAWRKMVRYAKQDVVLLEKVYNKLLPYITNHPALRPDACPNCGSKRIKSHGWRHTKTRKYRRFRCLDCTAFSRARQAEKGPTTKVVSP